MGEAIKHALANLLNLKGRDARQAFWFYVLFLFIINFVISIAMMIPVFVSVFQSAFEAAQLGLPEDEAQALIAAEMAGQTGSMFYVTAILSVAMILLLAASFVRRLHDSDHSGWWALAAIFAQFAAVAFGFSQIAKVEELMAASVNPEDMAAIYQNQSEFMAASLVNWIAPAIVIIFGVMKSTDGPNRYGEAPFTA